MDCGQRRAVESLTLNVITYFIYLYINVFFEKFSSKILYYSRCITRHAKSLEGSTFDDLEVGKLHDLRPGDRVPKRP